MALTVNDNKLTDSNIGHGDGLTKCMDGVDA